MNTTELLEKFEETVAHCGDFDKFRADSNLRLACFAYFCHGTNLVVPPVMELEDDWMPTPANINALPKPIRDYIMNLETNCDPAGTLHQNVFLQDQIDGLQVMYNKLKGKVVDLDENWQLVPKFVTKEMRVGAWASAAEIRPNIKSMLDTMWADLLKHAPPYPSEGTDNAEVYATLYIDAKHWFMPYIESGELPPSVIDSVQHLFEHWVATRGQSIPEGYCLMPVELTAENGAKALLLGEFHEETQHACMECADMDDEDNEDCLYCQGTNYVNVKVPVDWTTIKGIYRRAVDGLAGKVPAIDELPSRAITNKELQVAATQYIDDYEYADEYTPTEKELTLISDCMTGFIDKVTDKGKSSLQLIAQQEPVATIDREGAGPMEVRFTEHSEWGTLLPHGYKLYGEPLHPPVDDDTCPKCNGTGEGGMLECAKCEGVGKDPHYTKHKPQMFLSTATAPRPGEVGIDPRIKGTAFDPEWLKARFSRHDV